jgi:hypothetical protein
MPHTSVSTWILNERYTNFPKIYKPAQKSKPQKGEMKQVHQWGPTNIRHHRTKFCRYGDLAPKICEPQALTF